MAMTREKQERLSEDIHLLGDILGHVIRRQAGIEIFELEERIRELARAGAAVLMISSELPEVIGMSDRIIVMWDGTITGHLPAGSTEAEIMHLATGQSGIPNS